MLVKPVDGVEIEAEGKSIIFDPAETQGKKSCRGSNVISDTITSEAFCIPLVTMTTLLWPEIRGLMVVKPTQARCG